MRRAIQLRSTPVELHHANENDNPLGMGHVMKLNGVLSATVARLKKVVRILIYFHLMLLLSRMTDK